jgi:hypothetical protein
VHRNPLLNAQINAAPEPLRSYVRELETRVDPAGDLQELFARRENERALVVLLEEARAEIERLNAELRDNLTRAR